ncbi:response regulator transcription factor [Enterobacteriaceae bacterium BIT-l23]|uniref:Response regulator transcription factor n=1 Tax=Jejubacter calystegiae TaxID=2579935 RepID=A0A4P8YMS0_9ENTR|nr:response regulator transcription factor [Jejubacter calystegiae]NUU65467.1 response regulator transcription factor [Enterobacteriaceae bacterium BIT-l23]QCT20994.1 response regulator transcription factor [Jejubacter calystegiae]
MTLLSNKKITVALLDDHPMIRHAFEMAAAKERDIDLTGSFGHSRELLNWLQKNHADVLVLDYILGSDEMDGLSLIKHILARHPKLKILLSSSMESLAVIRAAFISGIRGYMSKREETQSYFKAVRMIASGQRFIPATIAMELTRLPVQKRHGDVLSLNPGANSGNEGSDFAQLTKLLSPREAEVIRCFLDGMQIIDIAAKLKRSRKTISGHKQAGMKKLGIASDLELFKYRSDLFK